MYATDQKNTTAVFMWLADTEKVYKLFFLFVLDLKEEDGFKDNYSPPGSCE